MKNFKQAKSPFAATLIILIAATFIIQSCSKDSPHVPNPFKEDKLLLSKVTGTVTSQDPNFWPVLFNIAYTYNWTSGQNFLGPNSANFQENFTYGKNKNGWDELKPVIEETFLNKGRYHFFYSDLLPDKVADSSLPGTDLGYWKFYFNNKKQVEKVGLGFSQSTDPLQFELYNYDNKKRLDSLIYELEPGNSRPAFKVVYQYNQDNDISEYQVYFIFPVLSASNASANSATVSLGTKHALSAKQRIYQRPPSQLFLATKKDKHEIYPALSANNSSDAFYDVLYLTAKITTDGKVNPFGQQGHILFYQTNRYYSLYDPIPFFLPMLKSNPIKVEYTTSWGPDVSVQKFSYSYNSKGYPVTIHEELSDPDLFFAGSYTRDSQIEYLENE